MESAHTTAQAVDGTRRQRNTPLFIGLLLVFLGFVTYSALVAVEYGPIGFVEATVENVAVIQVGLDLVISLAIALTFVSADARRRDLPFVPYLVATALTGSIGLLAYMLHRTWRGGPTNTP